MSEFDDAISDAIDRRDSDATTTDPDPTQPTSPSPPEDDNDTSAGRDSPGGIDSPQYGGGDDGVTGPPEDDNEPDNRVTTPDPDPTQPTAPDPTRTVSGSTTIRSSVGSDATTVNPDPTDPIAFNTTQETVDRVESGESLDPDPVSLAGDGPIASIGVPGSERDVGGVLDAGARAFDEEIVDPIASGAAATQRQDSPFMAGSPERAQLAEDFTRSAVGAANIPAAGAIGVRLADETARQTEPGFAGGPISFTADPERTEQTAEVTREAGGEAAEFAQENPGRAGAFVAGGVAGGLGAGAASRAIRGGARAGRGTGAVDDVTPTESVDSSLGGRGTGSVLDEADIQQPASNPQPSSRIGEIRRDLDELFADERAQLNAGRQRQRPASDDVSPDPTGRDPSREIVEGSPRDRISGDITRQQRTDLDTSRGTFDAGDMFDPVGGGRGGRGGGGGRTGGSRRVPRDPLDTSGGRAPRGSGVTDEIVGSTGVGTGLGTGAAERVDVGPADADLNLEDTGMALDTEQTPDVGVGPESDITPGQDSGTDLTPRQDGDQRPFERIGVSARTRVAAREDAMLSQSRTFRTRVSPREGAATQDATDGPNTTSTTSDRTRIGPTRGGTRIRDPPDADIDLEEDRDEILRADIGFVGATFESPTQTLGEVDEDISEMFGGNDAP